MSVGSAIDRHDPPRFQLADAGRHGNGDGKVTASEVKAYLDREMTYAARRQSGREQNATVSGDLSAVLATF